MWPQVTIFAVNRDDGLATWFVESIRGLAGHTRASRHGTGSKVGPVLNRYVVNLFARLPRRCNQLKSFDFKGL